MCGGDGAVVFDPHFNFHVGTGSRAGRLEDLGAAHQHLDRLARFVRHDGRGGFHISRELAAEAATDLTGHDLDLGDGQVEHLGDLRADFEGALRTDPDGNGAVFFPPDSAVVWFDIALVDSRGFEFAFDDDIGRGEPLVKITHRVLVMAGDIALFVSFFAQFAGGAVFVEQRRVVGHSLAHVNDRLQHFVFDLDQVEGLFGNMWAGRTDRSDGVAGVENLIGGQ